MIIISANEEIVFESAELSTLDAFLKSYTGQRMFKAVAAMRPELTGDPFVSGQVSGYEKALVNLMELVMRLPPPIEDKTTNYPDLDDETGWNNELPNAGDARVL